MSTRADRAKGTAFAILYQPSAVPNTATAPKKRGPKPKRCNLTALDNSAPAFNTPLPTKASQDRSNAIKRSPSTC